MMIQEKGWINECQTNSAKFDDMMNNRAGLVRWSETRLNIKTNAMKNLNGFEKLSSIK